MVRQSSDMVPYLRRYNLVNNLVGSSNQAKEALWEKKDLLEQHDGNLQEKKFRNYVVEVIKTRKTTIDALSAGGSRREPFPEVSRVGES